MCVHGLEGWCLVCLQCLFLSEEKFSGGFGPFTRLQSYQIPSCLPFSVKKKRLYYPHRGIHPVNPSKFPGKETDRQTDRPTQSKRSSFKNGNISKRREVSRTERALDKE